MCGKVQETQAGFKPQTPELQVMRANHSVRAVELKTGPRCLL